VEVDSSGFAWEAPRLARATRDTFPDKPWLAADSLTGNLYLSYTAFYRREKKSTDRIEFQRSDDGGLSWSPPMKLSADTEEGLVQGSRPAVGPRGELHVVWKTVDTTAAAAGLDVMRIRSSLDEGQTFREPADVALPTPLSSGPPGFDRVSAQIPVDAVDRTAGPHRGRPRGLGGIPSTYDDLLSTVDVEETDSTTERRRHAIHGRPVRWHHPRRRTDWHRPTAMRGPCCLA
jgi:hypothetical protein